MTRALAAAIGLLFAMPAAAQATPDWLRDLPSVQAVQQRIQGANTAQTLGRQCAALTRLERGADLPAVFLFNPTPQMAAVAESYRNGISQLQQRYNDTVKPLADADNRREWERMCGNRRSGVHPLTGEADSNFPALDQPLGEEEFASLLGPAARAAYEAETAARTQRSAATEQQRLSAMAAAGRRDVDAMRSLATGLGVMIIIPLVGFLLIIGMLRSLAGIRWQPGPGEREVQLGTKAWKVVERGGRVEDCDRSVQTVVTDVPFRNPDGTQTFHRKVVETIHWHVRCADREGRLHDLRLRDWDISVRPGDVLHEYSLHRNGKSSDTLVIANRTTGEAWNNTSFVHGQLVPVSGLIATPLVVITGFLTAGIGWLVGFWWIRRAMKKARGKAEEVAAWLRNLGDAPVTRAEARS